MVGCVCFLEVWWIFLLGNCSDLSVEYYVLMMYGGMEFDMGFVGFVDYSLDFLNVFFFWLMCGFENDVYDWFLLVKVLLILVRWEDG